MQRRPILAMQAWHYTDDDERVALEELEELSDRAAGIVATTMLENALDSVLLHAIREDDPNLLKELFSCKKGSSLIFYTIHFKIYQISVVDWPCFLCPTAIAEKVGQRTVVAQPTKLFVGAASVHIIKVKFHNINADFYITSDMLTLIK